MSGKSWLSYIAFGALFGFAEMNAYSNEPVKWDYQKNPVKATENHPASALAVLGVQVESAFDGFGAQGTKPGANRCWQQMGLPADNAPFIAEIDYGQPISVSAFVHYFYVPDGRDYRFMSPGPSAFKKLRVSSHDEGTTWTEVAMLNDLPSACPQVWPIPQSKPARYWRLEVLELAPGAEGLVSYEIETYAGGIPDIKPIDPPLRDFRGDFSNRMLKRKPESGKIAAKMRLQDDGQAFALSVKQNDKASEGVLAIKVGADIIRLIANGSGRWTGKIGDGSLHIESKSTAMGMLLQLSYLAAETQPVKYQSVAINLSAPKSELYYVPAYVWSKDKAPDSSTPNSYVQTRLAGLQSQGMMLCLIPGSDRGSLGFSAGAAQSGLLLGAEPTPLLITAIAGDWWDAYRFATHDVYDFGVQSQIHPVSEIQYGISRYMMSDEVWEPTVGTVRSWPAHDPHMKLYGFDCFNLYGSPNSIPTYWARYVMNGDPKARERARSVAMWLSTSSVRIKEGPMQGAFYTLQRFGIGETPDPQKKGGTQGWGAEYLTCQSTGAALWSLQFYQKQSTDTDPAIIRAIEEGAQCLLRTQSPDGSWPYGYDLAGKPVPNASPSSGSIWNIWALWRLAKERNNPKLLDAAQRGIKWYAQEFIQAHHYHGYWEDVGPGSREGYDAGIAAVALGEMGEKDLAVQAARDAIQWVFTRQIEVREASNSAGLVAEQTGWPPASYCNPMMALAATTAWRATGDPFWEPFAKIPKAIGWWYQPEIGAMVWIVDSTQMAPTAGHVFESWWSDWCIAQVGTLSLRWLVREANHAGVNALEVDEDSLQGNILGEPVHCWSPPGGFHPALPIHGQVNWLGLRGQDSAYMALMNDAGKGDINCTLTSRDVGGATIWPAKYHEVKDGAVLTKPWDGQPVKIKADSLLILEWGVRP